MTSNVLIIIFVISLVMGYALGNIHGALIIGKVFRNQDIRKYGSGNPGTTNALRVFGFRLALLTFIIDFSKAFFPIFFAKNIVMFFSNNSFELVNDSKIIVFLKMVIAIGVLLGHNYPALLKFKGGKGIASTVGIMFAINIYAGVIFGLMMLTIIFSTRYMSLASIVSASFAPIILYVTTKDVNYLIIGLLISVLAIYRHKENIQRLRAGNERKVGEKEKVR